MGRPVGGLADGVRPALADGVAVTGVDVPAAPRPVPATVRPGRVVPPLVAEATTVLARLGAALASDTAVVAPTSVLTPLAGETAVRARQTGPPTAVGVRAPRRLFPPGAASRAHSAVPATAATAPPLEAAVETGVPHVSGLLAAQSVRRETPPAAVILARPEGRPANVVAGEVETVLVGVAEEEVLPPVAAETDVRRVRPSKVAVQVAAGRAGPAPETPAARPVLAVVETSGTVATLVAVKAAKRPARRPAKAPANTPAQGLLLVAFRGAVGLAVGGVRLDGRPAVGVVATALHAVVGPVPVLVVAVLVDGVAVPAVEVSGRPTVATAILLVTVPAGEVVPTDAETVTA